MSLPDLGEVIWRKSSYSGTQTACVEMAWRKSSYSAAETDCVEVARAAVRDSKNVSGPVLLVSEQAIGALVASLKGA